MTKKLFVILLLLIVSTAYAQTSLQATVITFELNVRQNPGTNSARIGAFSGNSVVNVTGREDDAASIGLWVYATSADGTLTGWVLSNYLNFNGGNIDNLPIIGSAGQTSTVQPSVPVTVPIGALSGKTTGVVNFRSGPGTTHPVLTQLPAATIVTINGRNSLGTWLHASVNGQDGWLSASLVRVDGDKNALAVIDPNAPPTTTTTTTDPASQPTITSSYIGNILPRAREIYVAGQGMGNRRDVFSKVGDSITASPLFLVPIGDGGLHLNNYAYLQPVADFYMKTSARTHNSFANSSLAAGNSWISSDMLNPAKNLWGNCGEMRPLVCEYTYTKPAVALIMIGTNDVNYGVNPLLYESNLQLIVETSINMGVIPVLSTIPRNPGALGNVDEYNNIIVRVALKYQIPIWEYANAMAGLPNSGLGWDNYHPSSNGPESGVFTENNLQFGYPMRNLTALMALDAIWRGALYE